MKSVKHFFSTIARKMNSDEEKEDLLKPFRKIKKEDRRAQPSTKHGKIRGKDGNAQEKEIKRKDAKPKAPLEVQSAYAFHRESAHQAALVCPTTNENKPVVKSVAGEDSSVGLSSRSLRRLRDASERAVRKVKTFVSRPIKDATLKLFVRKVEAKKEAEQSGKIHEREMKSGSDTFPRQRLRKSRDLTTGATNLKTTAEKNSSKSTWIVPTMSKNEYLPSGNKLVYDNNNNDGDLMINGEPFWTQQKKPTDADLEESGTEEDIQLNAEVALDVYEGKTKLVNMPAIPIILDPMNELSELKRRDQLFFTKDVLFGNSIRSMINLCDCSAKPTKLLRRRDQNEITFTEPEKTYGYHKGCLSEIEELPAKPIPKETSRRSSRFFRKKRFLTHDVGKEEIAAVGADSGRMGSKSERRARFLMLKNRYHEELEETCEEEKT
ncbi:hypothetical protein RB195_014753 [Necator americanus]|uniref:Uncharacterized protein n=1 Tax=Necator americanus TaxID=51031 RepID=A0ABR1E1G6_NECAM